MSSETTSSPTTSTAADRLQVYYRIRPPNKVEREQGYQPLFETINDKFVTVSGGKKYSCDGNLSSQIEVYERVGKKALELALSGYTAGIMCYGQTGTGKTHTMCHDVEPELGLIPRLANAIFEELEGRDGAMVTMKVIQIYRDSLQDLAQMAMDLESGAVSGTEATPAKGTNSSLIASPSPTAPNQAAPAAKNDDEIPHIIKEGKLDIRYDERTGVEVLNAVTVTITSSEDFLSLFRAATQCRATAATKMNAASSRSHVAFVVGISYRNKESQNLVRGKLLLVDLAGYERFGKTDIHDEIRKDEARTINASLLSLGNVIQALAEKAPHVPWRNSKLTRLMQDCVGGRAQTSLILTMGPSDEHMHETLGTLFFGSRAMNVAIQSSQDVSVNHEARAARLQALLDDAQERICQLENENRVTAKELSTMERRMQEEVARLQEEHKSRLREMVNRGESTERIQNCVQTFAAELETVLEQQMEQRSYADFDSVAGPLLLLPSLGRSGRGQSEETNLGELMRERSEVLALECTDMLNSAEKEATELRRLITKVDMENKKLKEKLQQRENDVETLELDLTVEKSRNAQLQAQIDQLESDIKSLEIRIELAEANEIKRLDDSPNVSFALNGTPDRSILVGSVNQQNPSLTPQNTSQFFAAAQASLAGFSPSPLRASLPVARLEQAQTLRRLVLSNEEAKFFSLLMMQFGVGAMSIATSGSAGEWSTQPLRSPHTLLQVPPGSPGTLGSSRLSSQPSFPPAIVSSSTGGNIPVAANAAELANAVESFNSGWSRLNMLLEECVEAKVDILERSTKMVVAAIARAAHQIRKELRPAPGAVGVANTAGGGVSQASRGATPQPQDSEMSTVALPPTSQRSPTERQITSMPTADSSNDEPPGIVMESTSKIAFVRSRSDSQVSDASGQTGGPIGQGRIPAGRQSQGGASFASNPLANTINNYNVMDQGSFVFVKTLRERVQQRPESHRMWLYSGRSPKTEQRGGTEKIPTLKPMEVLQQSSHWNPSDLHEYRSFVAYHLFVVGDHHVGKSSFIHCLTHKAPKLFKRPPSVQTPTIRIERTMHCVTNLSVPCPDVPRGGQTSEPIDVYRLTKETAAVSNYNVEFCEMPPPLFHALNPGSLPCRGAAYFLVYSLLDDVTTSRRKLEQSLVHLFAMLTATYHVWHNDEQMELDDEKEAQGGDVEAGGALDVEDRKRRRDLARHPILKVPVILVGTGRDQLPSFKKDHDDSEVQASLRSQRDWFERFMGTFYKNGDIPAKTNIRLELLDSFAVSHSSWELSGERPRSPNSFEHLLQDTIRHLAVHSPINPEHFLPTSEMVLREPTVLRGDRPWELPPANCALDVFWGLRNRLGASNGNSSPRYRDNGATPNVSPSLGPASVPDEKNIVQSLIQKAAVGIVTFITTMQRWKDFAGTLSDYFVIDNLIRTHFGFTDAPSSTVGRQPATSNSARVMILQNRIIRYFLRWCTSWGLLEIFESADNFAVVGIRSAWRDALMSRLLLPSVIDDAANATGRAKLPIRTESHLMEVARERLGLTLELASLQQEFGLYRMGQLSLQFVQHILGQPLDAMASNAETALLALTALGFSRSNAAANSRRTLVFGDPLPGRLEFFFPTGLRPANEATCNITAYAMNIIAEGDLLEASIDLHADSSSLFTLFMLDLAASGDISRLYCWSNAATIFHRSGFWALLARRDYSIHICIVATAPYTSSGYSMSSRPGNSLPSLHATPEALHSPSLAPAIGTGESLLDMLEWIRESLHRCASLYPCTSLDTAHSTRRPPVLLWDEIENTTKEILANMPNDCIYREINVMRSLFEHTVEPRLDEVVQYLEWLA